MGMILGRERERFETRAQANLDSLVELSGQRQATYAASIIERMANWTRGQLGPPWLQGMYIPGEWRVWSDYSYPWCVNRWTTSSVAVRLWSRNDLRLISADYRLALRAYNKTSDGGRGSELQRGWNTYRYCSMIVKHAGASLLMRAASAALRLALLWHWCAY